MNAPSIGHAQTLELPHREAISGLQFDATGTRLLTSDWRGGICIVDWTTRKEIRSFTTERKFLNCICLFPHGKLLATGTESGPIELWETQGWSRVKELKGHSDAILAIQFAPNHKTFVSAGEDDRVLVWDAETHRVRFSLEGHQLFVESLAVSPDSKLLASGDWSGVICIWDLQAGKLVTTITAAGPSDAVMCLAFSPDGKTLFSGAQDNAIKLWDTETWKETKSIRVHSSTVKAIIPWADGRTLISASEDSSIATVDIKSGERLSTIGKHDGKWVMRLALSPDAKTLVSGDLDGRVKVWDLTQYAELRRDREN